MFDILTVKTLGEVNLNSPLYTVASHVTKFDDELREFIQHLKETASAAPMCLGLAAPQVGKSIRVFVIKIDNEWVACINPSVITFGFETVIAEEACLSVPGFSKTTKRNANVVCRYRDETGAPQELVGRGMIAVCLQHENDHLNGVLICD